MRPASLLLSPDRQNDDTDTQPKQDQKKDQQQDRYWERRREQDAAFHASGNSAAAHNNYQHVEDQFESRDDDSDSASDIDYEYHEHHGNLAVAAVMTQAPVDGDEDPEYLPDSFPLYDDDNGDDGNDHSNLDPSEDVDSPSDDYYYHHHHHHHHYHHHHHHHHHHHQGDHDLDMSDSDGGAPLDSVNTANDVILSDLEYDSEDPLPQQQQQQEEEDEDAEDDETDMPTDLNYYTLPPDFHLHMHDPIGTGLVMDAVLPTDMWIGAPPPPPPLAIAPPPPPPIPQALDNLVDPLPPVQLSNPNPSILGSENLGLVDFLRGWAYGQLFAPNPRIPRPDLHEVIRQAREDIDEVLYSDLGGDSCDVQGLDWESMGTTRQAARKRRQATYKNYVNRPGSDQPNRDPSEEKIPSTDSFFRFKRMDLRRDVSLAHFQLRSVLACPSRTRAFYPSAQGINVMNTVTRRTDLAVNLREFPGMAAPAVSTLDAACGVLMGGTFNGDYCLQALGTEDKKNYSEGQISTDISGITNHIKIYRPRRSWTPVAAIASNDHGFRVMDLQTEKFVSKVMYPFALNCSAISPDGRLRVVVGDNLDVLITNADSGEVLQELSGHRDYGFACDWSDNGYTVATGFQDKGIRIWDARRWCNSSGVSTPLCTIRANMSGVRSLRFSPTGSGKPVLVAAEEADYINIIDAQTFCSKQTVDVFGEIGGVAFDSEGQNLNILCCDAHRGGLLQLERCGESMVKNWRREPVGIDGSNGWDNVQWHTMPEANISRRRNIPPPYMDGPEPF